MFIIELVITNSHSHSSLSLPRCIYSIPCRRRIVNPFCKNFFKSFFKKTLDNYTGICYYIVTERGNPKERKERTMMNEKNGIEITMEWMVEEALAAMEAKGEKLPEIRYGEKA